MKYLIPPIPQGVRNGYGCQASLKGKGGKGLSLSRPVRERYRHQKLICFNSQFLITQLCGGLLSTAQYIPISEIFWVKFSNSTGLTI